MFESGTKLDTVDFIMQGDIAFTTVYSKSLTKSERMKIDKISLTNELDLFT